MSDEVIDEPITMTEIGTITLSDGAYVEIKPFAIGATSIDFRRKAGYIGDCTISVTVTDEESAESLIRDALETELVTKTKQDYSAEEVSALRKQQINSDCQRLILSRFSLIHQIDVAHGLYPDNGMKQWIADMIEESNKAHDLINTLGTIEEITAVNPEWPEYMGVI